MEEFDEKSRYEIITDHTLYLLVAKARLKCGDNKGALRDLGKALKLKKTDPSIYLQRGICFENLKDWKNAIKEFSEAIVLNPGFSKAYFHRAICLGHCDKISIEDLNTAIKLDVGYFEAHLTRASYYFDTGNFILRSK